MESKTDSLEIAMPCPKEEINVWGLTVYMWVQHYSLQLVAVVLMARPEST
jgi:hypothetical protein